MWRSALLTAAVLLGTQTVLAQPPFVRPGTLGGPAFPTSGIAMPGTGPAAFPTGSAGVPALPRPPITVPSAPITAPPSGPNPGLVPPPVFGGGNPAPVETTIPFNPDLVELRWLEKDHRWQLYAGEVFLKDFGRYESEGREVLRVVQQLRLNSLTTVGTPRAVMEYWLANGEAPRGFTSGLRTVPLDAANLKAEQVQGQWCVHDNTRILFNFGQQGEACRQALAAIQRYGFTQVGYVGQVSPVMLVFLANPAAPAPLAPPTSPQPNRFPDLRHLWGGSGPPQNTQVGAQGTPSDPAKPPQPNAMPAVTTQPLNPANSNLHQTGGQMPLPASLRLPGTEAADRITLDPRVLQVRRDGGDWKLAMGNHVVANFGPAQADAQLAQAALRYFHCTEQVYVGNPQPAFSYFLSNGQAPHGVPVWLSGATPFRPDSLSVREMGQNYVLYDGSQVVMSFGPQAATAQQALQAIQQHKFDHLAMIGRGDQSMLMLLRAN